MKVKVKLFANFREAAKQKEVEVTTSGNYVSDAIKALTTRYPNMETLLFQDGKIKPYVNILHNGQSLKGEDGLKASLKEGDEIALFPPVSGG